jgi:hypothetical protein
MRMLIEKSIYLICFIKNFRITTNQHSGSNNSKDSNPFGEDDEAENTYSAETKRTFNSNEDSDDEKSTSNYLSIKVKALYDYNSAEDDELSFKAGKFKIINCNV